MDPIDEFSWEHFLSQMEFLDPDEKEMLVVMRIAGKAMMAADNSHLDWRDLLDDQSVSEDEAERLIEWARGVRIANALLDNTLQGKTVVAEFGDDEDEPSFRLSDRGTEWARGLAEDAGLPIPDEMDRDWGEGA